MQDRIKKWLNTPIEETRYGVAIVLTVGIIALLVVAFGGGIIMALIFERGG